MLARQVFCLAAVAGLLLTAACESRPPEVAFDGRCWIRGGDGRLTVLDAYVENLETCGARLAVRHIQHDRPVSGAFGGVDVFVDAHAIEAGTPYPGQRILLISAADRSSGDASGTAAVSGSPCRLSGATGPSGPGPAIADGTEAGLSAR